MLVEAMVVTMATTTLVMIMLLAIAEIIRAPVGNPLDMLYGIKL